MSTRLGRPRVSSRAVIAEAATELFLEQGYDGTSIADITRRAGVGRSSFFNYFGSKADVIWGGLDERVDAAAAALRAGTPVAAALRALADAFAPDALALAITNADPMGLADALERERAVRQLRLGRAVAERLAVDGTDALRAEIVGAAASGAVFAAIWAWAGAGAGSVVLADVLERALAHVPPVPEPPPGRGAVGA